MHLTKFEFKLKYLFHLIIFLIDSNIHFRLLTLRSDFEVPINTLEIDVNRL